MAQKSPSGRSFTYTKSTIKAGDVVHTLSVFHVSCVPIGCSETQQAEAVGILGSVLGMEGELSKVRDLASPSAGYGEWVSGEGMGNRKQAVGDPAQQHRGGERGGRIHSPGTVCSAG